MASSGTKIKFSCALRPATGFKDKKKKKKKKKKNSAFANFESEFMKLSNK